MRILIVLIALLALVGCGGGEAMSEQDRQQLDNEFAMAEASIAAHFADDSDLPPELEALARQGLFEEDTRAIVTLVRKWDEQGMSDKQARQHLSDAVAALGDACQPCLDTLDRERSNYE